MRRIVCVGVLTAMLVPVVLTAQGVANCRIQTQDACQRAQDFYGYMLPQLGLALGGGNPVLGSNSVIGRLGHFSIGLRGTVLKGSLPQFDTVGTSTTGAVARDIPVNTQWLGAPAVDAAVGLFRGFQLGVTRVGSLDALVSAMYLPSVGNGGGSGSQVAVQSHTKFGFGGRIGLLEESIVIPAVSFAYLQRGLPRLGLSSQSNNGASFGVDQLDITVSTWRVIAAKSFLAFSLSGGVGGDTYKSTGALTANDAGFSERVSLDRSIKRTNWFLDLTLDARWAKVAAEVGGGGNSNTTTFNHFSPVAGSSLIYYSFGLRVGF